MKLWIVRVNVTHERRRSIYWDFEIVRTQGHAARDLPGRRRAIHLPQHSFWPADMPNTPIVILEARFHHIKALLARLRLDSSARLVVLLDKDGQQIAVHGDLGDLDTTSLASLAAGNVAATGGMAKLIGENEFPTLSHEGEKESIHICVIGRVLLLVVFDDRSSLGLVKLRSRQLSHELAKVFIEIEQESADASANNSLPFSGITDEEIDSLFSPA
ncbi:MAG: roadblock/LC7 domain-containing protein [Pyrinomonadaceae bacterium]